MPGASRIGDVAGGTIVTGSPNVNINGIPAVRIGDVVSSHGDGEHNSSVMVSGSPTVFINGIPLVKAGDVSSCGHAISGSSDTFSN
jgi:uncharacterized Zn-binding protein involved in type VI secretion